MGALKQLVELVEDKNTSIRKLRQILFGASTEKTEKVLDAPGVSGEGAQKESKKQKGKAKGHGRKRCGCVSGSGKDQDRARIPEDWRSLFR